ncbi:MAG: flavodoxin family protein [Deltaproteobacteria bacterium]|nr:flavodoxin family protein [Deltaproteobacteria bacterium]
MRAIGIVGSPRRNGNTEYLMNVALSILEREGIDSELIPLAGKEIKPCDGCLRCKKEIRCVIEGDDFEVIYRKMRETDGIILGSPVYFSSATPQLISLLDRAAYVSRQTREFFSGKIGGPIVVARRAGHNFTFAQLLLWFFINDMIIVGSSYWNVALAGSGGLRDIEKDTEAIETVRHFAYSMARLMKKVYS